MTKKKKLAIGIAAVCAAVIVAGGGIFAWAKDLAKKNAVGIDTAISIAMADAGATEENTVVTKAKMDFEKGVFVYDIEFTVAGAGKYDYTVKASDGTILNKDLDSGGFAAVHETTVPESTAQAVESTTAAPDNSENSTIGETSEAYTSAQTSQSASGGISLEEAKSIALRRAGVSESEAQFIKAAAETDDGATHYDIEFVTSSYKYDFEIDLGGNVLSYDKEMLYAATTAGTKYIGVDKAKKIALESAGVSQSAATFTKAKLEREDRVYVYEIEFVSSGTEYEYEINATTGEILSQSSEPLYD